MDADDLAQETFLQAMLGIGRFAGESRVETWLYGILIRIHGKRRRAASRIWSRWLRWFDAQQSKTGDSAADRLEMQEWNHSLWHAVARLPDLQQQTLILRYSEDLPLAEIAVILGCPIGTVKSRLSQGLSGLQRMLVNHETLHRESTSCGTHKVPP